jgi:hypothetical protein
MSKTVFQRKPLDQICTVPKEIIDVYVVENHIWAGGGSPEAKKTRKPEHKTIREFLIDPVRPLLNDVLKQLAAPYNPADKTSPIGQGWWVQAEFGSGKSHLLSFLGALALGEKDTWEIVRQKEEKAGKGKRESIYQFYENGVAKKSSGKSKGIFLAVKTLVGQGGGTVRVSDTGRTLTEYILDAVQEQFFAENGKTISLYPEEMLADRFLAEDFNRFRKDLAAFLKDPKFFDEEEQEDLDKFMADLRNAKKPAVRRDCGDRLWRFYRDYLKMTPQMPAESEQVLEHMVRRLLAEGYEGVLLFLDEVSLFSKIRSDVQRVEDEKTLVVLSNRLAKVACLPAWTICTAQQAIESKLEGSKNIIANDRLKNIPLLNNRQNFYDIILNRVRTVTDEAAIDPYYEDYRQGFTWPEAEGRAKFGAYFPFYPRALEVVRSVSYHLTTLRSSVHFMHQTLKSQCKAHSKEMISLWQMFDDVVSYEEDPSGTTAGIAAIQTKFNDEWQAYEAARRTIGQATKGRLKVYASRCEKILKTLFLYHIARMDTGGLPVEEIMNSVMEWQDHAGDQQADAKDNLDHYEILCEELGTQVPQVRKIGKNYVFEPTGGKIDIKQLFEKARNQAAGHQVQQRNAWEKLLGLEDWKIESPILTINLTQGVKSIFRAVAPAGQKDVEVSWHNRTIKGRVYMRDLLDIASKQIPLPPLNTAETDLDFAVFISTKPCGDKVAELAKRVKDHRVLFWTPDALNQSEQDHLLDFAAYRELVGEYNNKDSQDAKDVMNWVADRLRNEVGSIYKIVPDSYARGRLAAADHGHLKFTCEGELPAILEPLVGQVLDGTYASATIDFTSAPAPFDDAEAIKVINGIVRTGEIPKNAKPTKDTSAADNYGYALGIMKKTGIKKLDTGGCVFAEDIEEWIEAQIGQGGGSIPVASLYKNFTGLGGPNGKNYGLSRRMIDVYLLSLVRQGKLRISLSGKATATVESIDYANLEEITFNAALLGGMAKVQRLRAPEGWAVLAPYAAVLLDDETVKTVQQDADIQKAVMRLLDFHTTQKPAVGALAERLKELFDEIRLANPVAETLADWKAFFESEIDRSEPIAHLRNALDRTFGYKAYEDNEVKQVEADDLATRKRTWVQAAAFAGHDREVRAASRYAKLKVSPTGVLADLGGNIRVLAKTLTSLDGLMESEAKLQAQLLDPLAEIQETYRTRYLQAYDNVTGRCEAIRYEIDDLARLPEMKALEMLASIEALGKIDVVRLKTDVAAFKDRLFQTTCDRNDIERALRDRPDPEGCALNVDQAEDLIREANAAGGAARSVVRDELVSVAGLLRQPALWSLLEQGRKEPFIAEVLATADVDSLADLLAEKLTGNPNRVDLLAKYLKRVVIKVIRFQDFRPSKSTVERDDIEAVVDDFRRFLEGAFARDGKDQSVIVDLHP